MFYCFFSVAIIVIIRASSIRQPLSFGLGAQLPADRAADADWGGDFEARAGRLDLHGGAMTSPEDLTRTRGMVLRYI